MASITPLFIYFAAPLTLDLCCCSGATFSTSSVAHVSEAKVTSRPNVHIPDITLEDLREAGRPEDIEEWEQRVTSLFEWIGLAGLGSQRCVHVPCIWFLSSQLDDVQATCQRPERSIHICLRAARAIAPRRFDHDTLARIPIFVIRAKCPRYHTVSL